LLNTPLIVANITCDRSIIEAKASLIAVAKKNELNLRIQVMNNNQTRYIDDSPTLLLPTSSECQRVSDYSLS
jgi:hypothetical protein